MPEQIANAAETTLATAVDTDDVALHPSSTAGFPSQGTFRVRLGDLAAPFAESELATVTSVGGGNWTVVRGAEGTTAQSWGVGTPIALVLTAGALTALLDDLSDALGVTLDELSEGLTEAITAEATARASADTGLTTSVGGKASKTELGSEATARESGDGTNATAIAAEKTRAEGAETAAAAKGEAAKTAADAAKAVADAALPKTGGTMTGKIVLDGDPSAALHPVTRQYLEAKIAALIGGAPEALDTLKELSDALGNEESAIAALTTTVAGKLAKASNLSDVANAATARSNLGAAAQAALEAEETARANAVSAEKTARESADATEKSRAETAENLKLAKASNLSDLGSASTARSNLGLGTAAVAASTAFDAAGAAAAAQAAAEGFASTADGLLVPKTYLDTDGTLAANSDTKVATQKATKTLVATKADLVHASRHQYGGADALALPQYDPFDALPYVIPMNMVPGTTLGPTAKRGYMNRFTVGRKREFKFVRWAVGTVGTGTADKVEAVICRFNSGTGKVERLGTSGAVAFNFTTLGPRASELTAKVTCEPGFVYFVGWALEVVTGTPQLLALLNNNGSVGDMAGTTSLGNRLMMFKKELMPWPETIETMEGSTPTPYLLPSES